MSTKKRAWTDEQQRLLELGSDGLPVMNRVAVLADAGSGKTSVLVERVRLIKERRPDDRVLCVSFTERSSADLKSRLMELDGVEVYTIHGFCARILKEAGADLRLPPLWRIADEKATADLLYGAFETVYRREPPSDHLSAEQWFDVTKAFFDAEHRRGAPVNVDPPAAAKFLSAVKAEYEGAKGGQQILEYADLEALAVKAAEQPTFQSRLRRRYAHVFVDEFQDTSEIQCRLVTAIAGPQQTLFVVGDPKQSIYRFRGADVDVFERYVKTLPFLQRLSRNFRSKPTVIDAVNAVCAPVIPDYGAMSAGREGEGVVARVESVPGEAARVISILLKRLAAEGVPPSDAALLLPRIRGNEELLAALQKEGLPLALGSAGGVLKNPTLQALLRLWVWACEPWHRLRAAEAAARFLGEGARDDLARHLEELQPPPGPHTCTSLLTGLDRQFSLGESMGVYFEQFKAFILSMQEEGLTPSAVARRLARVMLEGQDVGGMSLLPPPSDVSGALKVLTVHGSKGLEYPVVLMADLEGRKPARQKHFIARGDSLIAAHDRDGGDLVKSEAFKALFQEEQAADLKESARLLYVAMTRAEDRLYLIDERADESAAKKPKARTDTWAAWARPALPPAEFDGSGAGKGLGAADGAVPRPATLRPLAPVRYQEARRGVTSYIKGIEGVRAPRPRPVGAKAPARTSARSIGTLAHHYLEYGDWKGLREMGGIENLDFTEFFRWLETDEGRLVFGPPAPELADGPRVLSEVPFEWLREDGTALVGRVDRIVLWPEAGRAWVVDYKFIQSRRDASEILAAYGPQLAIYGEAAGRLFGAADVKIFLVDVLASTGSVWHCLSK